MRCKLSFAFTALSLLLVNSLTLASASGAEPNLNLSYDAIRSFRYENARTIFNYGENNLSVSLQPVMPECPEGMLCIQVFPSPVTYELTEARTTKDSCSVLTTTARIDNRPVDGALIEVKIVDYSNTTCNPKRKNQIQMNFSTEIFSRGMEKPVRTLDKFLSTPSQAVYGAELKPDSSARYESASVTIDGRTARVDVTLTDVPAPCPKSEICELLEPSAVYKLKNAQIRTNECGVVQTVAGFDDTPVDGIELKVTINNNLGNICPTSTPLSAIDMTVEQRYYSRFDGEVKITDTFRGDNVRLIKPAK